MISNLPLACFVHLGDSIPKHLERNLARTRRLFPDLEILLITDAPAGALRFTADIRVTVQAPLLDSDDFRKPPKLNADPRFWSGYWQKTFNRLYALQAAFIADTKRCVIHIESDVLLMPSFPFEKFVDAKATQWGDVGNSHDVAALLVLPDRDALLALLEALTLEVSENSELNDMTALSKVARAGSVDHCYLPMSPDDPLAGNMGIFDGAPWGHFIYGTDPRAFYGRREVGRRARLSRFNPADYELSVTGQKLLVNGYPLHTLHIHSKALFAFSDGPIELKKRIDKATSKWRVRRTTFILPAFAFAIRTMVPIWLKSASSIAKWRELLMRLRG